MAEWSTEWLTELFTQSLTEWRLARLTERLTQCFTEWFTEWRTEFGNVATWDRFLSAFFTHALFGLFARARFVRAAWFTERLTQ